MVTFGVFSLGFFLGYFFFWIRLKWIKFLELNYRKVKSTKNFKEIRIRNEEKDVESSSILDFQFRPNTHDKTIFDIVNKYNEYRLPSRFDSSDVIIDIGAHIGSFSYACLTRGVGKVHAYEAFVENAELASKNLKQFGKSAVVNQCAVWRSDRKGETLFFTESTDTQNTGGGNVWANKKGIAVPSVTLDEIISQIGKSITLLKLDCEGSEFPILFTSKRLNKVNAICGEYHEFGGEYDKNQIPEQMKINGFERYTIVELTKFLEDQGFEVWNTRSTLPDGTPCNLGLFFAERKLDV